MAFSSETIRRKSRSTEEYERGKALYDAGKVRFVSSESFWKGEEKLKIEVEDAGRTYAAVLSIQGDCISGASCQCASHQEYKGLCCHEAAAALYAMEKKERETSPRTVTSQAVRKMIHRYTNREITSMMAAKMQQKVQLYPVFHLSRGRVFLYLKIGITRQYLLKDLAAFAEALESDAYVEYGRQLGFYHCLEAFEEESARLAEEIIRAVGEYRHLYDKFNPLQSGNSRPIRELELSPASCDSILKILVGSEAEVETAEGMRSIKIRKENPRLTAVIRSCGRDGARITMLDDIRFFMGKRRLYLLRENTLYCCDRSCTASLQGFLDSLRRGNGAEAYAVEMNLKDLPSFCDYVLPKISEYITLESAGIDLKQYHTAPLSARFYFASPTPEEITLSVEFWYADQCFSPFERIAPEELFRDRVGELIISTLIKQYFSSRYAAGGSFTTGGDEEAMYRLLSGGIREFEQYGEVFLDSSVKERKILPGMELAADIRMDGDWLELTVDTGGLSNAELAGILSAYKEKKSFYRLRSGEFLKLKDAGFGALSELSDGLFTDHRQSFKNGIRVPRYRGLYLDRVLKDPGSMTVTKDAAFQDMIRTMRTAAQQQIEIPPFMKGVLREYQKAGYYWLRILDTCGFGGILADDMGLGKTVQIIALLAGEAQKNPGMQALIVCPASLLYNWKTELKRFAPQLYVRVITGSGPERKKLLESRKEAGVMITSYDLLRRDIDLYADYRFRFQIIDEAQYIKNAQTQNARAVKKITAQTRYALSGTPIENSLGDLWSIFDYLMPGILYSRAKFRKEFEIPAVKNGDRAVLKRLQRMTSPFLLRRYKKDVLKDLPDKLEHIVYSRLEQTQNALYAANALKLKSRLMEDSEDSYRNDKMKILAELMRLRQICCDPALCYEDYRGGSAKLETCMELIRGAVQSGHKLLLFSQFTSMLELIGRRLEQEEIGYYKLTGETGKEERIELVDAFNHNEVPVFLISLKAGGTGLNLTAADIVIHYDPWWNLSAQNQATDRAHRIGQNKVVSVFRLIAGGTIEEGILKLQERKRELSDAVIGQEAGAFSMLTRQDLIAMLEEEAEESAE